MSRSILLIDDDAEVRSLLARFFDRRGWLVLQAGDARSGADAYDRDRPDLVLLDLELPDLHGLQLLEVLRQRDPDATVIMLTGHGDIATAVEAMRLGAENFLSKPVELAHVEAAAERAVEKLELRRHNRFLTERFADETELGALGRSPLMREIARQIELLAQTDTTVLLTGETGTGKGWVARVLHSLSRRAAAPFVDINCAGLSATFLDSELFGHEKGAFTDAKSQKRGLFEVADGGTLFLDEVGDLSADLQPKLLKVLEAHRFRRLGGTREINVNVRLVAATNRNLEEAVRTGDFREDLFYRLNVLTVRLPPLRARGRDEIADLASRLLLELRKREGRGPRRFSADALAPRAADPGPGNSRELRNVIERVLLLAADRDEVAVDHLPRDLRGNTNPLDAATDVELPLQEVERRHIQRVLAHCGDNRSRAASLLGISRATLYEKLRRYGVMSASASGRPGR